MPIISRATHLNLSFTLLSFMLWQGAKVEREGVFFTSPYMIFSVTYYLDLHGAISFYY